jgi:hypothetical protein
MGDGICNAHGGNKIWEPNFESKIPWKETCRSIILKSILEKKGTGMRTGYNYLRIRSIYLFIYSFMVD